MTRPALRLPRAIALAVGIVLVLAYAAAQLCEPHGAFEFAYAPFTPAPLPYSAMRGFTYEQLWGHVRRLCLLGPGLLLLGYGLSGYVKLRAPTHWRRVTLLGSALCLVAVAVLMLGVLRGRPITDDELAYGMQAGFFGRGKLTGPDLGLNPGDFFTVTTRLGYTIKYLPGEPLMQIVGVWLGVPALLHLPIVAITLWAFHTALERSSGSEIAHLATLTLACSPMLVFTSASGLSHATALMWVVLMGLGAVWGRADRPLVGALLCGLSFSLGLLTRPQSMVPIGAVLGVWLLAGQLRKRSYAALFSFVLSAGAGVGFLLLYDFWLTGSALKLPWFLQCGSEHYGLGRVWATSTYEHGVGTALENLLVVLVRLNGWLLGLPLSLVSVALWLRFGRPTHGAAIWLWVGAAVLVFEFFYYSPGASDTGSIYHYELLLPFALITGSVVRELLARSAAAPLALVLALLLGTGSFMLEQGLRLARLVSTIHAPVDATLDRLKRPALLIHEAREAEIVRRGWVFDSFARRFRNPDAPIVTVPRASADMRQRAERVYPGRHCYYFHHRPGSDVPELLDCDHAEAWLSRRDSEAEPDAVRPYVEKSTAYLRTDFNPAAALAKLRVRGPDGQPQPLCCQLRAHSDTDTRLPAPLDCIETGEP